MSDSQVRIEGLDEVAALLDELPRNALFGASIGLNRTMDEAQAEIRQSLPGHFTLRRKTFVERTIYRKPGEDFATKDRLLGRVRIHDDRDFLAKFEQGGTKTPTRGRRALAVPVDVKRTKTEVISKANQVRALLASGKAFVRGKYVFQVQGRGRNKRLTMAYVFKSSTPLPADLHFEDTGRGVIVRRAVPNLEGAIEVEISRGLTFRSGAK